MRRVGVLDPTAGVDRKEQGKAISKFAGAGMGYAICVISDGGLVDIKARRVGGHLIDVKKEKDSNAQQRYHEPMSAKKCQKASCSGLAVSALSVVHQFQFANEMDSLFSAREYS